MPLFDVHAHLTHRRILPRIDDVLSRARAAGLTTIISNGLNPADNERVRALAARSDLVKPAYGLYPVDAVLVEMDAMGEDYHHDDPAVPAEEAVAWVADHVEECLAVGEIGLDHYWVPEVLWERQEQVFRELVAIALEADKPIIVHTRKAERRAFEILVEMGAERVDWHCFGSKVKLAKQIAEHGHYFSIPANARKAEAFTRMLQKLPRDRLLLETDCPYLAPVRGQCNEPANVAVTAAYAAELWSCTLDEVQAQLSANFERLFNSRP
jgi:TatD DNase family protein